MDVFATLICTAANVTAARNAQTGASFSGALSATGAMPATHYVASGWMAQADVDAAAPHCAVVVTGSHRPTIVIADAGLQVAQPEL